MKNLLVPVLCLAALPLAAVTPGASSADVIAEKGPPASKLERGSVTVFTYADAIVRLENDKVTEVKPVGADYAVKAAAPADTPRPARSRPTRGSSDDTWSTDYAAALGLAQVSGRKVLLFFTGSDWCGWCVKLDREVLGQPAFLDYARDNLVLVKLDFPKGIPQPAALREQNRQLAEQYGIRGYPTLVVLDSAGNRVGRMGYQRGGPGPFIERLKRL